MIGINNITNLLELVVWSGHIRGEQPVSVLLTAPPEAGKTSMVMKYSPNEGLVVLTDCTAYGIMRDYREAITTGRIRHIIIPDFIKPMSRGMDTVHSLVAFLNSLIEEGVISISTYAEQVGVQSLEDAGQSQIPVRCGLITTIAQGILHDGRHHWARMGFMSRMLPISYTYNAGTQLSIHRSIASRDYASDEPVRLHLPVEDVEIRLQSPQSDDIITLASGLNSIISSVNNPERVYGFRLQKHLQRLAMASALKHGRDIVNQEDVDYLRSLVGCVNLEYYPI